MTTADVEMPYPPDEATPPTPSLIPEPYPPDEIEPPSLPEPPDEDESDSA